MKETSIASCEVLDLKYIASLFQRRLVGITIKATAASVNTDLLFGFAFCKK